MATCCRPPTPLVRVRERLGQAGIDPVGFTEALDVPPLVVDAVDPPDEGSETRSQIAFIGTILLYGQILGYGFWVALGVVEEKSSRVVEVLLSTIRSRAARRQGDRDRPVGPASARDHRGHRLGGRVAHRDVELDGALYPLALVLGWFVLGYLFYSCLFAAAAARVSRQEEMQNATTPLTMLVLVSFFAAIYVAQNPDSTAATILSVVPPFSR